MELKYLTAVQWLVNEIFAGKTEAWQKEIEKTRMMEELDLSEAYNNGHADGIFYQINIEKNKKAKQ
jgi:hypothetical protein